MAKLFGISPADLASVDFSGPGAAATGAGGSGVLPEAVQEEVLLDDLLYALMGFAGRYVFHGFVGSVWLISLVFGLADFIGLLLRFVDRIWYKTASGK